MISCCGSIYFLLEYRPPLYSDCFITSRLWFSQAVWFISSQLDSLRAHTLPPIRFVIHVRPTECARYFSVHRHMFGSFRFLAFSSYIRPAYICYGITTLIRPSTSNCSQRPDQLLGPTYPLSTGTRGLLLRAWRWPLTYTGCFMTLGHNCRRWFPRSL
jgi:hypothetical protein